VGRKATGPKGQLGYRSYIGDKASKAHSFDVKEWAFLF